LPLYQFTCKECGGELDELMKYSEKEEWLKTHVCSCGGSFKQDIPLIGKTASLWG